VVHSATKYLGGHSDVLLGLVAVSDDKLFADIKFIQNSAGGVPGPQDCFLTLRGIKTLHLRMERHCDNAEQVAAFLRDHPKVEKVFFPGFADHPGHAIAKQQMRRFGGIVTIWLKEDTAPKPAAWPASCSCLPWPNRWAGWSRWSTTATPCRTAACRRSRKPRWASAKAACACPLAWKISKTFWLIWRRHWLIKPSWLETGCAASRVRLVAAALMR
jgi:hypothetical protein